jgi:hypothetical protein
MNHYVKPALLMELPDGKVPGFYAQIIKALANKVELFDRDKELLVVNKEEELHPIVEIMAHYKVKTETMELLLLPEQAVLANSFEDYGFISRAENHYLYRRQVSLFRFVEDTSNSERVQAVEQLTEHVIAHFSERGDTLYAIDKQLEELTQGIAEAYHCEIKFIE